MKIAILTIVAAAAGAASHFVPGVYGQLLSAGLTTLFAHFGVTFATGDKVPG